MSDLKEKVRKEFKEEISELVAGVMFTSTLMNAANKGSGFAFIDLIIEELEKISGRKVDPVENEKTEVEESETPLTPKLKELRYVKSYTIADISAIKDVEKTFNEDERFLKEQLAKAVMECMETERTWDCLGNFKITTRIWVNKK